MKGITCIFAQTFHYPTFQLLDVSALPLIPHSTSTASSSLSSLYVKAGGTHFFSASM